METPHIQAKLQVGDNLETFLVEWKQQYRFCLPSGHKCLETFLFVEFAQGQP